MERRAGLDEVGRSDYVGSETKNKELVMADPKACDLFWKK
jgi:hypothetical protein